MEDVKDVGGGVYKNHRASSTCSPNNACQYSKSKVIG